jgi:hypothetical protein
MPAEPITRQVRFTAKSSLILLAVGFLLLTPSIAGFFTDHESRSRWEKRELAKLDQALLAERPKEIFSALDAFIDDHIGFARSMNKFYRQLQFYLFGDSPIPNVSVDGNGFVFVNAFSTNNPHLRFEKTCRPTPESVANARHNIERMFKATDSAELTLTYAVVPSKPLLYADRLPKTVPVAIRKSCRSLAREQSLAGQLASTFRHRPYQFHFPLAEMIKHRQEPAFYPPENFHANSLLNHLFADSLLRTMGIDPGPAFSEGAELQAIRADITMLGFKREALAWTYPYSSYQVDSQRRQPQWIRTYFKSARDFGLFETTKPASDRVALVLSNSFGKYLSPHIAPGFRKLHHISLNDIKLKEIQKGLSAVLARLKPSDLIILVHDGGVMEQKLMAVSEHLKPALLAARVNDVKSANDVLVDH